MVSDEQITELLSSVHFGALPDVIEIKTTLPEVIHTDMLLGSVHKWLDISSYYGRPVRIYAICDNVNVEKCVVGLVNPHKDLFITIVPTRRKELLEDGNGI